MSYGECLREMFGMTRKVPNTIPITIKVDDNGWWTALADNLDCVGAGSTKEDAIRNLELTLISTIKRSIRLAE